MEKKLLSVFFALSLFLLNPFSGFGQCPTSVSISASPGTTICAGTEVTFSTTHTGGSNLQYQWQLNSVDISGATSATYVTSSLANGAKLKVIVKSTSDGTCSTASNELTMTVNAVQTPTVSISTTKTSICPGESITFNATNTYGGTSPQYAWYINTSSTVAKTGASAIFSDSDFNEGNNTVRVVLTSNFNCANPTTAEATSATFELIPDAIISTPTNNDQTVCINKPLENIAFALGGGATNATVTGLPPGVTGSLGGGNFNISGSPTTKGTFSYTVTTTGTCAQKTATGTITVNPDATIALTSGNNTQTVCAAGGVAGFDISPITYSIGETGTGATVTGLPTGISGSFNNGVFTIQGSSSVTGSHVYSVKATGTCGDSAPLTGTIVITDNKVPSVAITSSDADNTICAGTSVSFTATPTNGGANPTYQWKVNGTNAGTNSSTFTTAALTDGQAVTVEMSSSETCLTTATVASNVITTTVNPNLTPEVTIITSDSNICPNDSVTFTATPVHGGSNPTYQWKIGSTNVGTNSSTFTTTALTNGQSVSVILTSNETCLATPTATSNSITTTVNPPIPPTPGSITGSQEVCATATGLVYSVEAVTDAESYAWTFPTGWSITNGQGTRTATFSASSTSGNISVSAVNNCGTGAQTSLAVTAINGVLPTPGTITAPNLPTNAICPPATGIEFNVPVVTGAQSYLWTLPSGWEITSGSGTNAIVVRVNSTAATTANASVSVEAVNICGNSPKSTISGIAVDNHVITNAGPDQTACKLIASIDIVGEYSFSGTNANLKPIWSVPAGMGSFATATKLITTFTPSQAALDAGSVILTLTTDAPSGSCGPGKDEVKISFKPLPTATVEATSPVCNGNSSTVTFTGTPNSRVTYKKDNGTNQTIDIGNSGTATVDSGPLTANTTYTLISSINLDTPACTNTLSGSVTITVTPKPTASISYAGSPFCTSVTTAQPVSLTGTGGYTGGTYSSTTGLSINTSTGAITPDQSAPGTYTVSYNTPEAGGCESVIATTEVTITKEPTAAISYAGTPFCTSDSVAKPVTLTGTDSFSGGTYSAPAGVTIDPGTGAITASSSTAGTYTVTYKTPVAGGCSEVTATTEITITNTPTAGIEYAGAPFCHSDTSAQAVILTGSDAFSGGTFTAPSGLSIDSSSGAITPSSSTPGTYEITYTSPASAGCGEVTAITSIIITETPAVEISYSGPYCTSDATAHSPEFTNTAGVFQGGVFRSIPDGLSLDSNTGAIIAKTSSPNTYTVIYELPAGGGCGTSEIQTSVTITQVPQLEISYTSPLCTSDTTSYSVSFSSNAVGAYQGGTFTATAGLAIDSAGNIIAANSTPGIHTVTYTTPEANSCGPVAVTTQIFLFEKVMITTPPVNVGICSTEPASFEVVASGDNLSYQWKRVDGAAITNATGVNTAKLSFSNATATNAGEYYVEITGSSPCAPVSSDPVTLNVDENIVIIKPTEDLTFCDQEREDVTFEFIAHANGAPLEFTWIKDGADIPNTNTGRYTFITSNPSGTNGEYTGTMTISNPNPADNGVYAVRISGPDYFTCSDAISKTFTLNVTPLPEPPTTEPVILCQGETAEPLTAGGASGATFKWYTSTMEPIEGVPTPSTVDAGNTSYFVSQTTDVCESDPTELVVTVNPTPAMPTTQEALLYCFEEENVSALSATVTDANAVLNWYGPNDPSLILAAAPTPITTSTGNTTYWVSQSIGDCESNLVEIVVTVNPLPELIVLATNENICKGSSTILRASGAASYIWSLNGAEIGTTAEITVNPVAAGSYIYKVTGTDTFGCVNTTEITIEVEIPSEGGITSGPDSVCTGPNEGIITLSEQLGDIVRWESSEDGQNWTAIAETSGSLSFENLTGPTQFRGVVKNGVCDEAYSSVKVITMDPLPVGGELAFEGFGRVLETCSNPGSDYDVPLSLSGQVGEIVRWRYKEGTATGWSTVLEGGEIFTGNTLSPALIRSLGINQSTIFEAEIASGACSPNAFSQNATLSIISSDIAPNPVTVTPGVVCLGELVTLTASTGYGSGPGFEEGGAFDFSSITNKGWRIKDKNGVESNFDSSADNGVAAIWLRTNPLPLHTAYLNPPYNTYSTRWASSAGTEGNKGFAVVSGPNPSTLETSIFNLFAVENPVLTFDQGYNLTPGSAIYVDISTNGGVTYQPVPLFELIATNSTDGTSGNYNSFGDGDSTSRPKNKMELDLTNYAGLDNLRIRFRYEGTRPGDVWAVDAISLPVEPTNVDMVWTDYTDPDKPVVIGTNNSEQWEPTLIGLNEFEIKTRLTFDSIGAQCPVVENSTTINVYVFDQYSSTAEAVGGSCGYETVQLKGSVINSAMKEMDAFPTPDGYSAKWEVVTKPADYTISEAHFSPSITDTAAIFSPGIEGEYTLQYSLSRPEDKYKNESCPPIYEKVTFTVKACTTLDFDGVDDFVDLGEGYIGNYSIEAWIRPFDRPIDGGGNTNASTGTIITTSFVEINMEDLAGLVTKNDRWYHIAVDSGRKLYIDGIDSGRTISKTGTARAFIGARWNAPNPENHFSGWIEEVRIWDGLISQENIRFTMNQRLKADGNIGVEVDMVHPDSPDFGDLAGYYQLIATNILNGGYTPNLAGIGDGKLRNMETLQENTAPLPYFTKQDGSWDTAETWARPTVWQIPNSGGLDWNIVRTSHNVNATRDISVLGLISEANTLDMVGTIPANESHLGVGTGKALTISHYLKLDGIIDLNGESQLLQPELSIVDEASSGFLDRDQQGKRNSFVYNYWSSPVSTQLSANNGGYSVGSVLKDATIFNNIKEIQFKPDHWAADFARTNPITISTYWLWTYKPAPANIYAEWDHIGETSAVKTGEGFTMKGTDGTAVLEDGQNYTFRGKPHNGDITLPMGPNQNYLIGNPYPSAFDAYAFITDNLGTNPVFDGSLYFWDHFVVVDHILKEYIGGYAVLNLSGGVPAVSIDERINDNEAESGKIPQQYIPVGQGFLINSTNPESDSGYGGDVKFKNSQRVYETEGAESIFLKPEIVEKTSKSKNSDFKKIRLSFSSPIGYHRQILVGAVPGSTNGFDLGYDAHLFDNNVEDMYWVQGNNNLVIQAVADFNKDRVLSLGVKIKENKEFRIRIDTVENAPASLKIYLNDKLKDSIHDLRTGSYVSTSEPGFIHDRFEIIFFKEEPPVIEGPIVGEPGQEGPIIEVPETDFTTLTIKHAHNLREVQIMNPDKLIITSVYLFDLNGNLIENYTNIPQNREINLRVRNYSSGVYLLKVYAEGKIISKKIIISN